MKKRMKILLAALAVMILAVLIGGDAYLSDYYHASDLAVEAMAVQEDGIQVEQDGSVTWFLPGEPTAGLIFYPGGMVEDTAYAPLMRAFAENGILCGLVKMPGNLAVLSPNAADYSRRIRKSRNGTSGATLWAAPWRSAMQQSTLRSCNYNPT